MKKDLIIITGPTGVGKTDLSEYIAQKVDGEIINIDLGQFYKNISIGTAKPDLNLVNVKHHLFDVIEEPRNFSVAEYRRLVIDKIQEVWQNKKRAILVGGSGFYITSLLFPPLSKAENIDINIPEDQLWKKLNEVDSERASKLHPNDIYRIKRALSIYFASNQKPSSFELKPEIFFDRLFLIILERNREELYKRIDERAIKMLNLGWINEVKNLDLSWHKFLKYKKIIGYDIIVKFLEDKEADQDILLSLIQQKTRQYAKKQITYFKMFFKLINDKISKKNLAYSHRINLSDENYDLYINQLLDKIMEV